MKLAVIVGHNSQAQGAVRSDTGETEYIWNSRLAQMMERLAPAYGIEVKTFHRTAGGGYRAEIRRVYDLADRWGADASIELHFNGHDDPDATGTETLSSGTPLSLRLAAAVQSEVVIALGLKDRGIKTVGGKGRGGASLISGSAPAILVEPFFGSSPKGQKATDSLAEQNDLARAYLRGAAKAFEGFPRSDLEGSRTIDAVCKQRRGAQGGVIGLVLATLSQITDALLGGADNVQDAAGALQPLAEYLPMTATALTVLGIVLFVYSRWQSERIEQARLDDHRKELR